MIIKVTKNIDILVDILDKKTLFKGLFINEVLYLKKWTDFCDFIEYFNAYIKNHLKIDEEYHYKNINFELTKKDNSVLLAMYAKRQWYTFSKLEASQLVHKCNRILARCDLLYIE